ncbi:MAG TPA: inosine/xanthosine triphosphatase [Candidatus Paceibacterota bacterium]
MKKIAVASKNPVKINATKEAFEKLFPGEEFVIESLAVPSGVADQPMTDAETFTGAANRVKNLAAQTDADFWVALEGGVEEKNGEHEVIAWAVVKSKDGKMGKGRAATFFLPRVVSDLIREGKELAHAADIVFKESESGKKMGTVGLLTNNIIDRTKYYVDMVVLALIPFKNGRYYR